MKKYITSLLLFALSCNIALLYASTETNTSDNSSQLYLVNTGYYTLEGTAIYINKPRPGGFTTRELRFKNFNISPKNRVGTIGTIEHIAKYDEISNISIKNNNDSISIYKKNDILRAPLADEDIYINVGKSLIGTLQLPAKIEFKKRIS